MSQPWSAAQAEIRRLRREAGPGSRAQSAGLALGGGAPEPFRPPTRSLALISCGDRYAVASWGEFALEGAWVWRWKDRIDRRFVERYRLGPAEAECPARIRLPVSSAVLSVRKHYLERRHHDPEKSFIFR